MANNKVQLSNGNVIIDLTSDTVTSASHIKSGLVGHLKDGSIVTGTLVEKDVKSVTYNLTGGATASVSTSEVVTGQGFSVKLNAPSGYNLSNVTITMGGIDITEQVFTPDERSSGGSGDTYVRTEILPSQTFTGDSSQRRATLTGMSEGFTDGEHYIVTYDGTEWLTTCETLWSNNYAIGEAQWFLGTPDAVYPFGVIWMSGNTCTVAAANTSQHTIKIEHLEFVEDGINLGTKSITQNGTYSASSDSLDGFSSVTVNCSGGTPSLQTKSVSYTPTTSAQSAQVTADSGYDGLEQVNVSVGAIPSEYIIPSGSQTVTENGTFDVSSLAEMVVNVASGGGSSVATGTVTPAAASTTISFDTGLSTITGILVMPINTPLTGSRTQAAMICLPSGSYYKAISIHTNSGGTGWVSPTVYTSNKFSVSGTTVTVTGAYSFRPAVGYIWYAW